MSFDKLVEAAIQEAMARGEFKNLPGQGKPINLTEYFNTPEDVRVAQVMLKNAGMVPSGMVPLEIELLQEIAAYKELLNNAQSQGEKEKLRKVVGEKQLRFNLLLERRNHHHK